MISIASLTIYPVKSMKGVPLQSSEVDLIGLKGDRRWLVIDADRKFQTIREYAELAMIEAEYQHDVLQLKHPIHGTCNVEVPDASAASQSVKIWRSEVIARCASSDAGMFLSGILGRPLNLVYLDNPTSRPVNPKFGKPSDHVSFADGYPILLTSVSSLQNLEIRVGRQLSMRRFRTNITISGADAWAEDTWRLVKIGSVRFRIARPCGRCIVTTLDPDTGEKTADNQPLAALSKFHRASDGEIIFGQNLIPEISGTISVGDTLQILEAGTSNLL